MIDISLAGGGGASRKLQLINTLRNQGIMCEAVLSAMHDIPREIFMPSMFHHQAYDDRALPIGLGQTISQPSVVAAMTQSLQLNDRMNVLEIGTGSGYQAAILAKICRRVTTIERHPALHEVAKERFEELRLRNITAILGDGMKGWKHQAPFDAIILTAAAQGNVPDTLFQQMKVGGIMAAPVGQDASSQRLIVYTRVAEDSYTSEELMPVRFVPLLPEVAEHRDIESSSPDIIDETVSVMTRSG